MSSQGSLWGLIICGKTRGRVAARDVNTTPPLDKTGPQHVVMTEKQHNRCLAKRVGSCSLRYKIRPALFHCASQGHRTLARQTSPFGREGFWLSSVSVSPSASPASLCSSSFLSETGGDHPRSWLRPRRRGFPAFVGVRAPGVVRRGRRAVARGLGLIFAPRRREAFFVLPFENAACMDLYRVASGSEMLD